MSKIWIDERHYKIKHIGEEGEYWKTYQTNVTQSAIYITEDEAERLVASYEGGKEMTSLRQWQGGVDEDGRQVFYETKDGETTPICAYEIHYQKDQVQFIYTKLNGETIEKIYAVHE